MKPADRLDFVKEYYFSKKLREIRAMKDAGAKIINFGIGSPDLLPPPEAVAQLQLACKQEGAHQYQSYLGLPEMREAFADFYQRKFNVKIDPSHEILPLMGSKEGIMHISMAFLNPGDKALVPNPGYPTYTSVTKLAGGEPLYYELEAKKNWNPDFEALEEHDLKDVKIMWLNYPHMPTGASGSSVIFEKAVAFAQKHNILLVNDNPYSFVLNPNPQSLLEVKGAKEVAIELNSVSKTFNMSGWRVGAAFGSEKNLGEVIKVKSNMDSGMFFPVQKGVAAALKTDEKWLQKQTLIYNNRKKKLKDLIEQLGCQEATKEGVGMFLWAKIPEENDSSENFAEKLLQEKHIFVVPGTVFGSQGEGYVRFSLCVPEATIEKALKRIE